MDMDGVLYPFDRAFNRVIEKHGGKRHDFRGWINFSEVFGDEIVDKVWEDSDLFRIEDPYDGAVYAMQQLDAMEDVQVYFVTNPGRNPHITIPAKWEWIQEHLPWVHHYQFVTTHAKWLFQADMIVEDHPPNIEKFLKYNPTKEATLIMRPWNERKVKRLLDKGVYAVSEVATLALVMDYMQRKAEKPKEAVNE
jgi:5'(3')-deoxyribonucleotidase